MEDSSPSSEYCTSSQLFHHSRHRISTINSGRVVDWWGFFLHIIIWNEGQTERRWWLIPGTHSLDWYANIWPVEFYGRGIITKEAKSGRQVNMLLNWDLIEKETLNFGIYSIKFQLFIVSLRATKNFLSCLSYVYSNYDMSFSVLPLLPHFLNSFLNLQPISKHSSIRLQKHSNRKFCVPVDEFP